MTKHCVYFSILSLVGALKRNGALQELYLGENNFNGYQDSMQLGDLLKYNGTLKTLDLSNNSISDSGMGVLVEKILCAFWSNYHFGGICIVVYLLFRSGGDLRRFELSEDRFENADTE